MLVYLYVEGLLVNEELARAGLVLTRGYEPNTTLQDRLDEAAAQARGAARGIWSPEGCMSPLYGAMDITEVQANPPGPDEENLNGEWIELRNPADAPVDTAGWSLRDESSVHRLVFPAGTSLEPGGRIRVFSGCGDDTASELFWCAGGPVWDNAGDTAFLLDAGGRTVAVYSY